MLTESLIFYFANVRGQLLKDQIHLKELPSVTGFVHNFKNLTRMLAKVLRTVPVSFTVKNW